MPIPLFHSIASWALKKRITQIELFVKYPSETQQEVLFKLLNTAKNTEIGIEYNFSTIISLHPIAGFGEKTLTNTEFQYVKAGKSYSEKPLIESMPLYQQYAENLSKLKNCEKTLDFRNVFDNEISTMYIDIL